MESKKQTTRDKNNLPFRVQMELANAKELVSTGSLTKKGYDMLVFHYERMGYNMEKYRNGEETTTNNN